MPINIYSVFTRHSPGIHHGFVRHLSGIHEAFIRNSLGICQVFIRYSSGVFQAFVRHSSGIIRHSSGRCQASQAMVRQMSNCQNSMRFVICWAAYRTAVSALTQGSNSASSFPINCKKNDWAVLAH